MPRSDYKTITVKKAVFRKFIRACSGAKKSDEKMDNSKFLGTLLKLYRHSSNVESDSDN